MAFLKTVATAVLGAGIGYGLLRIATPDESDIAKVIAAICAIA